MIPPHPPPTTILNTTTTRTRVFLLRHTNMNCTINSPTSWKNGYGGLHRRRLSPQIVCLLGFVIHKRCSLTFSAGNTETHLMWCQGISDIQTQASQPLLHNSLPDAHDTQTVHTHTWSHTHVHINTHRHKHIHKHVCTHTHMCAHIYTQTHIYTNTETPTHIYIHTHTRTHTHTQVRTHTHVW